MDSRIVERRRVLLQQLSNILMELEDLSVTQEEKYKSLDLAGSFKHACLPAKELKRVETSLGIEQALEPGSQEFLACLPPVGGQGYEDQISEGLENMDIDSIKTQEHQGIQEFIENWFQSIMRPQERFLLQVLLDLAINILLVPHIHSTVQVQLFYLDIRLLSILMREWLLWKSTFT